MLKSITEKYKPQEVSKNLYGFTVIGKCNVVKIMASTPKPVNGNQANIAADRKRKKQRSGKGSYLTKWLDKSLHHIHETTPSMDTCDSFINTNFQGSQFAPGYDPCRFMYGYTPEPASLPAFPTYYNVMNGFPGDYNCIPSANKSVQVQRARQRRRSENKAEEINSTPLCTPNGTLSKMNYMQSKTLSDSQDFASLPPIVTSVGDTTSNSDLNTNDKDDASHSRRYSDPCVQGLPDIARPNNAEVDTTSNSSGMSGSQVGSRLLSYLLDQIQTLKSENDRLNKDLQEAKVELTCVRQQNALWHKSSGSSMGTPNHSPLNNNGLLGGYSPGALADAVREIRDAARAREEALYARVRAMLHERQENGLSSELKFSDRSLEDIKSCLRASEAERRRVLQRVTRLEDELAVLRGSSCSSRTLASPDKQSAPLATSASQAVAGAQAVAEAQALAGAQAVAEGQALAGAQAVAEADRLRRDVAEMARAKAAAEEHSLKLERLVTQLRSKFNGLQLSGPASLASEGEAEAGARRGSAASAASTVVFGPVTDL